VILLFLRFLYLGTFCIIDYIRFKTFEIPEKVTNIPTDAKWVGGIDGGEWFYLRSKQDSIYYIEIYDDYTGAKIYDAGFVACKICMEKVDSIENIMLYITSFNGQHISLKILDENNKNCYLEILNPYKK
jgi:hypothetical protein